MWWLVAFGIGIVIVTYFLLNFTSVSDGTWKVVVRFGKYKKTLEPGLRWIGIRHIDKIYTYKLRWQGIEIREGREIVEFKEKTLDYVLKKEDTYWTKIDAAETKPPERFRLTIEWLVRAQIIDPQKVLFVAPPNFIETMLANLNAIFREWTGTKSYDEIIKIKEKGDIATWQEFQNHYFIKELETKWGIKILEIRMRSIRAPESIEVAAEARRKAELEAQGKAAETVGTVIQMLAQARKKSPDEIQKEIDTDPEMRKEFLKLSEDLIVRKMGIEGKAYLDIRVIGAEGLERMILNALAAWRRIPTGEREKEKIDLKRGPFGRGRSY